MVKDILEFQARNIFAQVDVVFYKVPQPQKVIDKYNEIKENWGIKKPDDGKED